MERSVEGGGAFILAIGTANPAQCIYQADFPEFYFRVTDSDHISPLFKAKFKRICEKSTIKKRYVHLTEEILQENEGIRSHSATSFNQRQDIAITEIPKLAKEAAEKAIAEWGLPSSDITHLIMCTYSSVDMPGADYHLAKLLGLRPSVKRIMIYQQGCHGGGMVLRLAKDVAENNKGARVLVVCSEMVTIGFRGPSEAHLDSNLVGQILFGDGAGAVIVGARPKLSIERPIFELVWTAQTILPKSDGALEGHIREEGLFLHLREDIPILISNNIESCLKEAFTPLHIHDWNSIFWIAHPGGPAILDHVEAKLGLEQRKLRATRQVLSDYGNMSSATVLFVLDEMRKKSLANGNATTGEGLEWGVLFGFGPGITVETVLLRSVPITN
ncbi:hypothetical protein V2J09_013864 [Rumex salicifolius]